jgi:hypothetical protein
VKKKIAFILLALSLPMLVPAYISVTNPKADDMMGIGTINDLHWVFGLPRTYKCDVLLVRYGKVVGTLAHDIFLADGAKGTGWRWYETGKYIGGVAEPGYGYAIRVTALNTGGYGVQTDDSGVFSLGTLDVYLPGKNNSYASGTTKDICWTHSGFPTGKYVDVHLIKGPNTKGKIAENVSIGSGGIGYWKWPKVGVLLKGMIVPPGNDYTIRVDYGCNTLGRSDNFAITGDDISLEFNKNFLNKMTGFYHDYSHFFFSIIVSKPMQSKKLVLGENFIVRWEKAPEINSYGQVKIEVYSGDKQNFVGNINNASSPLKPNSGQFNATLVNSIFKAGNKYSIRVSTPDNKYQGFSGIFKAVAN